MLQYMYHVHSLHVFIMLCSRLTFSIHITGDGGPHVGLIVGIVLFIATIVIVIIATVVISCIKCELFRHHKYMYVYS